MEVNVSSVPQLLDAVDNPEISRILLVAGDYVLQETLVLNRSVSLEALDNSSKPALKGMLAVRLIDIKPECNVRMVSITLTGGYCDEYAGAVYNEGNLTLRGCNISGNIGEQAGAILTRSPLVMHFSNFSSNIAMNFGGAITVRHKESSPVQLYFRGCWFVSNRGIDGGAVHLRNADSFLTGCHVINNSASRSSGGLYVADGFINLTSSLLKRNHANDTTATGGALGLHRTTAYVEDSDFILNSAGHAGGALHSSGGWLKLKSSCIDKNEATVGGGILLDASPRALILYSNISDNHARQLTLTTGEIGRELPNGGGIYYDGTQDDDKHDLPTAGEVQIDGAYFSGNEARGHGDSMYLDGNATVILRGNTRIEGRGYAGNHSAVYNLALIKGGAMYELPTPPGTYAPAQYLCTFQDDCWTYAEGIGCTQICNYTRDDFKGKLYFNLSLASLEVPMTCPEGYSCDGSGTMVQCTDGIVPVTRDDCIPCPPEVGKCAGGNLLCSQHAYPDPRLQGMHGPKDVADCICTDSYYRNDNSTYDCTRCPAGTECKGGAELETLTVSKNYWRPNVRTMPQLCPYETCLGGTTSGNWEPGTSIGCKPPFGGPFCVACAGLAADQYFDSSLQACRSCMGFVIMVIVFFAAMIFGACTFIALRRRERARGGWLKFCCSFWHRLRTAATFIDLAAKGKMLLSFATIVAQLQDVYQLHYPGGYSSLTRRIFSPIRLQVFGWIPGLNFKCLGVDSLAKELILYLLLPPIVAAVALVLSWCRLRSILPAIPFVLRLTFVLYPPVSSRGFQVLSKCTCFADEFNPGDQQCFLPADYSVQCDGDHAPSILFS